MLKKTTLVSLTLLGLAMPALAAPHPSFPIHHPIPTPIHHPIPTPIHHPIPTPIHPGHPGFPGHPGGHYHPGYHGHHHFPQGWWIPGFGYGNPGGYTCIANDPSGAEFRGYGYAAGETAIDQCYQFSSIPDECQVTWCG